MIIAILYTLISTGVLYLIYSFASKKWAKISIKKPFLLATLNAALSLTFLLLFVLKPSNFAQTATIESPVLSLLFTIFASYFYFLILPISGLQMIVIVKEKLYQNNLKRIFCLVENCLSIVSVLYISINIF